MRVRDWLQHETPCFGKGNQRGRYGGIGDVPGPGDWLHARVRFAPATSKSHSRERSIGTSGALGTYRTRQGKYVELQSWSLPGCTLRASHATEGTLPYVGR